MVQEVVIVSDAELRRRAAGQQFIVFSLVCWIAAYFLDVYAIEPLMKWLAEGQWPVWWLALLEMTVSIPAYIFGAENTPVWIDRFGSEGATWWQIAISWSMIALGIVSVFCLPYVLVIAVMITVLLAIVAAALEFWWVLMAGVVALFGGAVIWGLIEARRK